jgi:hypothetical protein
MPVRRAVLLGCLAAACGGAPAATATPAPSSSPLPSPSGSLLADPCWPVAPMRVVERKGEEWVPVAEMQGDGSMVQIRPDERRFLGRVQNDAVIDAHDVPSFTCIRREVEVPGGPLKGRYDSSDAYVDARTRVAIGDDGSITMTLGAHPPEALPGMRVEGPIARTRRTAALLVILVLAAGR